jgi:hypothetical protein
VPPEFRRYDDRLHRKSRTKNKAEKKKSASQEVIRDALFV